VREMPSASRARRGKPGPRHRATSESQPSGGSRWKWSMPSARGGKSSTFGAMTTLTLRGEQGRMSAGEQMRWLRRASLTLLVWLTAAMTLVAGTPHFTCRCPNGRVKPFCFGTAFQKSGCCCNGECCCTKAATDCPCGKTSDPDAQPVISSCCCAKGAPEPQGATASCCGQQDDSAASCCGAHGDPLPNVPAKSDGSVSGSCCTTRLVQPELSTPQSPEKPVLKGATLAELLALQPPGILAAPTEPCYFWQVHQRPPPTDLVIALQHFLI
jgi:hypothetical protein